MRGRLLSLALVAVAGLFAVSLPAQAGPTTCPATEAICIDESVEGQTPTITFSSDVPSGSFAVISPQTPAVGEEWIFTISVPFPAGTLASVGGVSLALLEPGSQTVSDIIFIGGAVQGSNLIMTLDLFSDNDLGQIVTPPNIAMAPTLTEDGTFQQLPGTSFRSGGVTFNVFLKSDIEVPEPASLALLGTALVGFGVMRRRRGLRWRNYEFTA